MPFMEQQCIFCHLVSGKIPSKKVYDDDKVAVILDINPASPGHVFILPKQHALTSFELPEEIVAHMGMVAKQVSQNMIKALKVEGTSIFLANGVAAGQRAPHVMMHVIPRYKDDQVLISPPVVKLDPALMQEVSLKLFRKFGKAVEEKKELSLDKISEMLLK